MALSDVLLDAIDDIENSFDTDNASAINSILADAIECMEDKQNKFDYEASREEIEVVKSLMDRLMRKDSKSREEIEAVTFVMFQLAKSFFMCPTEKERLNRGGALRALIPWRPV